MTDTQQESTANRPRSIQELWENIQLAWNLLRDRRVSPLLRFGIPILVAAYVILPIDLIPDVIPGLGQLDDIAMLWVGLTFFLSKVPTELKEEYRSGVYGDASPRAENPEVVDADFRVVND